MQENYTSTGVPLWQALAGIGFLPVVLLVLGISQPDIVPLWVTLSAFGVLAIIGIVCAALIAFINGIAHGQASVPETRDEILVHFVDDAERRQWFEIISGVSPTRFMRAMSAVKSGLDFSEPGMSHVLPRRQFERVRDVTLERGLVEWRDATNHNLGVRWTSKGMAFLDSVNVGAPRLGPREKPRWAK